MKKNHYGRKGVTRNYHHMTDTDLGQGIVYVIIISFSCNACLTQLSITCNPKIKYEGNTTRYDRVINSKYSKILGYKNNWIIMNFISIRIDYLKYEHINITILDVRVKNMPLVIYKGNVDAIDAEDSSCHDYYIIKTSSTP